MKFISNLRKFSFVLPSLMLTPEEQGANISKTQDNMTERTTCLTLQGMLYQNPDSWSLWVEGEKFTPKNPKSKTYAFEVHRVSDANIELTIEGEIKSFSIHDSFNPITGLSCK